MFCRFTHGSRGRHGGRMKKVPDKLLWLNLLKSDLEYRFGENWNRTQVLVITVHFHKHYTIAATSDPLDLQHTPGPSLTRCLAVCPFVFSRYFPSVTCAGWFLQNVWLQTVTGIHWFPTRVVLRVEFFLRNPQFLRESSNVGQVDFYVA